MSEAESSTPGGELRVRWRRRRRRAVAVLVVAPLGVIGLELLALDASWRWGRALCEAEILCGSADAATVGETAFLLRMLAAEAPAIVLIAALAAWLGPSFRSVLAMRRPTEMSFGVSTLAMAALHPTALWLVFWSGHRTTAQVESSDLSPWLLGLLVVVTTPVFEELLYRGLLFHALERMCNGRWEIAAIVVTLASWAMHLGVGGWPNALVLAAVAILLATIRVATGSIYCCIAAHFVWNSITFVQNVFIAA